MFSLLLFSCIRSRDFSLTRESNSLSDYWRVRLPSLEPRLPYIVFRVPIYLSGCNSLASAFSLLWIPWMVHSLASVFSPTLLSGYSGLAVSSCSVLAVCPRFLISECGVFSFFVSYAYFVIRCLVFVLPSFIHANSESEFAAIPVEFLRYVLL